MNPIRCRRCKEILNEENESPNKRLCASCHCEAGADRDLRKKVYDDNWVGKRIHADGKTDGKVPRRRVMDDVGFEDEE